MSAPYPHYPHHGHYHGPASPRQQKPAEHPFPCPESLQLTNCVFPGFSTLCKECFPLREAPGNFYERKFRVKFAPSNSLGAMQGPGISLGGILTRGPECLENPLSMPLLAAQRWNFRSLKYFLSIDGTDHLPATPADQLYIPGNCEHIPLTRASIAAWIGVAVAAHLGVRDVRYLRANLLKFEYVGGQMWKAVIRRTG